MLIDLDYHPLQGRVTQRDAYQTFLPKPPLNRWIQSFWQLNVPKGNYAYRSVPDNSVDLILNLDKPEDVVFVTPFSSPNVFKLSGPVCYFGIRFCILGQQSLIQLPLGDWGATQYEIAAAELLPNNFLHALYENINTPFDFTARCQSLSSLLLATLQYCDADPRLVRYIRYCQQNSVSNIQLSDTQCAQFGISSRQLRRLTQLYLGLLPREFARILRFQRTLQSMNHASDHLTWTNHYYDQPHFIREFKRFTGYTPIEFCRMSVLYNTTEDKCSILNS